MVLIKCGDGYLDVSDDFSNEEIDTLEKLEDDVSLQSEEDLEDTLELSIEDVSGDTYV